MGKKDIRNNFREGVLKRDKNECKVCKRSDTKLDAHHITNRHLMPNGGYVLENGITLCDTGKPDSCHMKAEKYHISAGQGWEVGFHPDDLYKLIKSSHTLAVKKSEEL